MPVRRKLLNIILTTSTLIKSPFVRLGIFSPKIQNLRKFSNGFILKYICKLSPVYYGQNVNIARLNFVGYSRFNPRDVYYAYIDMLNRKDKKLVNNLKNRKHSITDLENHLPWFEQHYRIFRNHAGSHCELKENNVWNNQTENKSIYTNSNSSLLNYNLLKNSYDSMISDVGGLSMSSKVYYTRGDSSLFTRLVGEDEVSNLSRLRLKYISLFNREKSNMIESIEKDSGLDSKIPKSFYNNLLKQISLLYTNWYIDYCSRNYIIYIDLLNSWNSLNEFAMYLMPGEKTSSILETLIRSSLISKETTDRPTGEDHDINANREKLNQINSTNKALSLWKSTCLLKAKQIESHDRLSYNFNDYHIEPLYSGITIRPDDLIGVLLDGWINFSKELKEFLQVDQKNQDFGPFLRKRGISSNHEEPCLLFYSEKETSGNHEKPPQFTSVKSLYLSSIHRILNCTILFPKFLSDSIEHIDISDITNAYFKGYERGGVQIKISLKNTSIIINILLTNYYCENEYLFVSKNQVICPVLCSVDYTPDDAFRLITTATTGIYYSLRQFISFDDMVGKGDLKLKEDITNLSSLPPYHIDSPSNFEIGLFYTHLTSLLKLPTLPLNITSLLNNIMTNSHLFSLSSRTWSKITFPIDFIRRYYLTFILFNNEKLIVNYSNKSSDESEETTHDNCGKSNEEKNKNSQDNGKRMNFRHLSDFEKNINYFESSNWSRDMLNSVNRIGLSQSLNTHKNISKYYYPKVLWNDGFLPHLQLMSIFPISEETILPETIFKDVVRTGRDMFSFNLVRNFILQIKILELQANEYISTNDFITFETTCELLGFIPNEHDINFIDKNRSSMSPVNLERVQWDKIKQLL